MTENYKDRIVQAANYKRTAYKLNIMHITFPMYALIHSERTLLPLIF